MNKKKVLFVGCFREKSKDGSVGGQMFACRTIINSELSDRISWTLIDSTSNSNILSSTFVRFKKAALRLFKFIFYILFFNFDHILIFAGDGWSLWEKGTMCLLAKNISKGKVIIAPRSGFILNDIKNKPKLKRFINRVFKKVDTVLCQSQYWKEVFEKVNDKSDDFKFIVIENMINFEKYGNTPLKVFEKGGKVTIFFMSWVTRNKGIFELLGAAKMLKNDAVNFEIIIAGKGDSYSEAVQEVLQNDMSDVITFKGWLLGDNKFEALFKSDIFVLPTYFDGYPNSLLEAMAAGKACIATKVGSIPDMITHMENGLLIDKENCFQLYEGLKILVQDHELRKKIALNAKEHVRQTNSIQIGISKFNNLLL